MRERYDNWTDGDGGDDSGFWNDEPTSRLERITQSIPRITQALPKLGQAFHRHHDEWDFRAEEPPAAPSTPRVYDQTEFDDLDEFDGYDAYSGRDGFNLRPAPMRSVARPTGPAVRRIPRTDDTSPTARLNVRRPATPPRPAGSRQHTGNCHTVCIPAEFTRQTRSERKETGAQGFRHLVGARCREYPGQCPLGMRSGQPKERDQFRCRQLRTGSHQLHLSFAAQEPPGGRRKKLLSPSLPGSGFSRRTRRSRRPELPCPLPFGGRIEEIPLGLLPYRYRSTAHLEGMNGRFRHQGAVPAPKPAADIH